VLSTSLLFVARYPRTENWGNWTLSSMPTEFLGPLFHL